MSRLAKYCLLAVVATMSACVSPEAHREVLAANDALQKQIADLQRVCAEQDGELRRISQQNKDLAARVHDAQWIKDKKAELAKLLAEFGTDGRSPIGGVTVKQTHEGTAFEVKGGVLFASGKADLTSQGRQVLQKLAPHLRKNRIRVDGHTDTDPITHSKWRTNLNLSAARAVAVAEFLIQNGLDRQQVSIAGFGEYRPVAEGDGNEAKAKNRRVEILLQKQ
jgi:chemotaxis protein MotB